MHTYFIDQGEFKTKSEPAIRRLRQTDRETEQESEITGCTNIANVSHQGAQ